MLGVFPVKPEHASASGFGLFFMHMEHFGIPRNTNKKENI
jgi:hypothetical protein